MAVSLHPPERWAQVACTGHREKSLTPDQRSWMHTELHRVAAKLIAEHGMRVAIHGGANGADLAWAAAADDCGVDELWAYLPFPQQTRGWHPDQVEVWQRYTRLRTEDPPGFATERVFMGDIYAVQLLHARNDLMIRDCEVMVAVVDPARTTGGTASVLHKIGPSKPVIVLDVVARTVKLRNAD